MSRILGIDHGTRRVGLALADEGGKIAVPYRTIEYQKEQELFLQLTRIIREEEIATIVVGMPFTLRGERGPQAQIVEAFVKRLKDALPISVVTIDERMTTPRAGTDADAACAILQTYLDQLSL